jgi:hypothetical protein
MFFPWLSKSKDEPEVDEAPLHAAERERLPDGGGLVDLVNAERQVLRK